MKVPGMQLWHQLGQELDERSAVERPECHGQVWICMPIGYV